MAALARTGDIKAFEELVRRRQGAVRGLMRRLGGGADAADDFAQEAFLLAWRKIGGLREPGAFWAWLRRIAVNVFIRHTRRKNLLILDSEGLEANPSEESGDRAVRMDLEKALARLRPGERLCLVLSYGEGLSHGQICSVTGLPLGTVKSHISRGRERMRLYLADYEENVA